MNKKIGCSIRNKRKELKITQSFLAEKIGCNYSTVCAMEKGGSVNSKYIFAALETLGLNIQIIENETY